MDIRILPRQPAPGTAWIYFCIELFFIEQYRRYCGPKPVSIHVQTQILGVCRFDLHQILGILLGVAALTRKPGAGHQIPIAATTFWQYLKVGGPTPDGDGANYLISN